MSDSEILALSDATKRIMEKNIQRGVISKLEDWETKSGENKKWLKELETPAGLAHGRAGTLFPRVHHDGNGVWAGGTKKLVWGPRILYTRAVND